MNACKWKKIDAVNISGLPAPLQICAALSLAPKYLQQAKIRLRVGLLAALVCLGLASGIGLAQAQGLAKKPRPELAKSAEQPKAKALFSAQEQALAIPGLGNPVAQLLVLREVNRRFPLTEKQRAEIIALAREEGPKLVDLKQRRARQERPLEEAIYGASFDTKRVEALANEIAETQKELMLKQAAVEARLMRILAQAQPRQARLHRMLYENTVGPQRNRLTPLMLVNRQLGPQWRILTDSFGEDWEMLIPSVNNPLGFLLVLRQLELTAEQKGQLKALAREARVQMLAEREAMDKFQREAGQRDELERGERPLDRIETVTLERANQMANREAALLKRRAHIESRIRQILIPQQWDDYLTLLRGMLAPALNRQPALPPGALKKLRQQHPLPGQ
jgi:Spy/CpxP family protein refolding chaperone